MPDRDVPDPRDGPVAAIRWVLRAENETVVLARELISSALAVAIVGMVLFAVSGLWPPLVAVKSGSMTPHLNKGDLVFVAGPHRFAPANTTEGSGVITHRMGQRAGYKTFQEPGNVIVYDRNGNAHKTPVIHRARFWVNKGENWYGKANPQYVGDARNCQQLQYCPAPYSGFITKGDANSAYDQVAGISAPVKPAWVRGKAELRIPGLGWIRLLLTGTAALTATPVAP